MEKKKKTRDRGGWKRLSDEAMKKLRAARHPRQREKEEEREVTENLALSSEYVSICLRFNRL